MNLGDKVIIGGRTMLRPGFSLVGLTGCIVSSRADAPPGTRAVWVDWEEAGYTDLTDLPQVVNVPENHLRPAQGEADEPNSNPDSGSNSDSGSGPKLRLV